MPIYEYACEKCENEFEVEQRITDAPVKTCPKCRSRKVKRLISRTSFVLKGGGWYSDLYASPGAKDDAGGDKPDGSGSKKDAKTDSKKDAKKDPKPAKADPKPAAKPSGGSGESSSPSGGSGGKAQAAA